MLGDEQTTYDRVLVTRSSILTVKTNQLMLGSKFKLPVKAEIVPYTLGNTINVTINALRLCKASETS